jgi:hypothetical protein
VIGCDAIDRCSVEAVHKNVMIAATSDTGVYGEKQYLAQSNGNKTFLGESEETSAMVWPVSAGNVATSVAAHQCCWHCPSQGGQHALHLPQRYFGRRYRSRFFVASPARAGDDGLFERANRYLVKNLTSDLPGASNTDPVLQNAWGVTFTPAASPFWISDNATGCSTLYDGVGVPQPVSPKPLQVKIPLPGGVIPSTVQA